MESSLKNRASQSFSRLAARADIQQSALLGTAHFSQGDILCAFSARETLAEPNHLTIQLDENRHIHLDPEILQYINHSCDPTVSFDVTRMALVALKPLRPDDELTFFYPSTEWSMARPFVCYCRSAACIGKVHGAELLSNDILARYALSPFVRRKRSDIVYKK